MRKRHLLFCFVMLALSLPAMAQPPQRVVSLLGSYAEAWLQAGGSLVGVTQDALTERQLNLDENTAQIGDNKNPSLELIISLEPDLVIYSTELEGQVKNRPSASGYGRIRYGV